MHKILQKVFSWFRKNDLRLDSKKRKSTGQSLVELALAFPILIILLSGVVEFGFILNYYLSLLDSTREAARFSSGLDPFNADLTNNLDFYNTTMAMVRTNLDPLVANPSYEGRRIILDPAVDDVIVTVYSADGSTVVQHGEYHIYGTHNFESNFNALSIQNNRVLNAPNAGILIVEVVYSYHQVLALPWLTAFVPNPLPLRAYTIFPISAAEPIAAP
jgi:hypothetical protein